MGTSKHFNMPSRKQLANLRPIKKGERRAAKDKVDRKERRLVIMMTDADYATLEACAKAEKLNVSAYVRGRLDIG